MFEMSDYTEIKQKKMPDPEYLVIQNFGINSATYIRTMSYENNKLCTILKNAYHNDVVIVPSGMNAISTTLFTILNQNHNKKINIVYASELYYETSETILWLKNKFNCTHKIFDIINHETNLINYANEIETYNDNLKSDINILFVESCSNPNGYVVNYDTLKQIKEINKNWIIIIDNTWLTHVLSNPFLDSNNCVDYVILSLTKYYSAGTAICGAIITVNNYNEIFNTINMFGLHVSPLTCQIVLDNIKNINERLTKASFNTINILNKLKYNKEITLFHPYNNNNKQSIFYSELYPSIFTIQINIKQKNITQTKFIKLLENYSIECKTSFGYKHSRIDTWIIPSIDNTIKFRLSIGYLDDYNVIYNELLKIIEELKSL